MNNMRNSFRQGHFLPGYIPRGPDVPPIHSLPREYLAALKGKDIGINAMLPASFTGRRRYMVQKFDDSMAICRAYGPPELFITFTSNVKWREIIESIRCEPGQRPSDRSDMIARLFHIKLTEMLSDIKDGHAFGFVRAVVYTVEFQKRGMPHAHILAWLAARGRDPTPAFIDDILCAEIPDINTDKLGFGLVDELMIHGPCGDLNPFSPCMMDGRCSKNHPKQFREETTIDQDGFPQYHRRDDGRFVIRDGQKIDNRWVVPYNLALLKKFQAHINVEWCNKDISC